MFTLMDVFMHKFSQKKVLWLTGLLLIVASIIAFQTGGQVEDNSPHAEQQWHHLLKQKDSIRLHWLRTLNPFIRKTEGGLVWNNKRQQGVMRFVNLPRAKTEQNYHLWIYDLYQPQEKPVSASVFRLKKGTGNSYYVAFEPEKPVRSPYKFLLTLENEGDERFSKSQSLLLAQP